MKTNKHFTSFTLIELITIVVIISILVSISVPLYTRAVERSRDNEAKSNLALIAAAEKIYRLETDSYCFSDSIADINPTLRLNLNENNFDYEITSASNFTVFAERSVDAGFNTGGFNRRWEQTESESSASCIPISGRGCP